jgi:deoxyribonuclease-4
MCNCVPQIDAPVIKVLDCHHRVGGNVSLQKTLLQTLTQKASSSSHCVQFYLGSRQNYKVRKLDFVDIKKSKEYCQKYNKTFYIHCPLIANLAKDPASSNEKDISILKKSWSAVNSEITQMNGLPAGCILHVGANGSINNLVNNLNDLNVPRNENINQNKLLVLENSAGQGQSLGRTFDEFRKIYEGIDRNTIGICIDTQHIFASGVNSLSNHEDVVKMFDQVESVSGGNPTVIHLNDSKKVFNAKVDRHENITEGYIWNQEKEGLCSLLDICYDKSIDCILETPDSCKDLDLIRSKYMDLQTIDTYL